MFYLTTHSTHFIYGYMASDIWLRTILIVRKETRCRHIGYSYRLTARVLLYAPSHIQDNTYHGLCYTRRGALAGTRNSSIKVTEAEFQTIGPLYLHAVWYLPFTNSPRKNTVTYHFSDLQEVYSGNRQIHTKCQLQYLHPPHISTSGKCHCVIIHQTTKATEYIG